VNTGVQETPNQAAQSLRIVRLVSFGAAAAIAALVLVAIASLRYAPFAREAAPSIVILSALEPPPSAVSTPPQQPPRPREQRTEQQAAPVEPTKPPAAPAESEPVDITTPVWISRPRNLVRFYPREAFMRGLSGQVVLDCEVDTVGRLACAIVSETPESQGFGAAAMAIAAEHVMQPALQNGAPVRGRYRMVVPFTAG
jgi:TonB family protein